MSYDKEPPTTQGCVQSVREVDIRKAVFHGSLWGFLGVLFLALIVPSLAVAFTVTSECIETDLVPIRLWLILHSVFWIFLFASAIAPLILLIKDGDMKKKFGCCLGVSFFSLFLLIVTIFCWAAIGAAIAVQCQSNPFPALTAFTVIDFVFSATLAIWIPIQLCCWW